VTGSAAAVRCSPDSAGALIAFRAVMGIGGVTQLTPTTGTLFLSGAVALMGIGLGLVIAPAGESIMSILPEEQGGVGSAVNDTVQELGGSLGVAVLGSLAAAAYTHQLDHADVATHLPAAAAAAAAADARSSIAAADAVTTSISDPALRGALRTEAHQAFTTAITHGYTVGSVIAALGAAATYLALPATPGH